MVLNFDNIPNIDNPAIIGFLRIQTISRILRKIKNKEI